jgi:cobaltochelatase CobN
MYQQLAQNYVLDKDNQDFMKHANPGALRGIEKLSEAVDRGMWQQPDPELISELQQVYLDIEGDVEDS